MNAESTTEIDETTTAKTPLFSDEKHGETVSKLYGIILRQQELIVKQSEHLLRAMDATLNGQIPTFTAPMSLRAEVDALVSALANITADDMARVAEFAKSMFDTLKGCGAVGGGAVRSQS